MKLLAQLFRRRLIRAINDADTSAQRTVAAINVRFDPKVEWSTMRYGVYPNAVGLQVFDRERAETMVRTFNSRLDQLIDGFRGLPIYEGHPDDPDWVRKNPGARMKAVGRIREMQAVDDGLRFRVAWNELGKPLIDGEAPVYEGYSPHWGMRPITYKGRSAFGPVELFSIGLTNKPNIPGYFIGLNEALPPETQSAMKSKVIALLAALGRPVADAAAVTDAQLESAVNEAVPVATKFVADAGQLVTATNETTTAKGQLTAAQLQVQTAVNEAALLRTQLAAERTARAGLVITHAINEGRLTEAKRAEWLGKFTADKADFPAIETELGKLQKAVNTQTQSANLGSRRGPAGDVKKITAINEAIEAKMGKMGTKDRTLAYNALVSEGNELFKTEAAAE